MGPIQRARSSLPSYVDFVLSGLVDTSRSIAITGFWRSGTTWLQQLIADALHAKRIFEPFYPKIERYVSLSKLDSRNPGPHRHAWMPFFRDSWVHDSASYGYLADCLSGRVSLRHESGGEGYWLRSARASQLEAFRLRTVVKFVRGQFMLPGLVSEFDIPVLHLRRDPRAVLASFTRKGWIDWFRCDVPLQSLLLRGDDGREEYFGQWRNDIEQIDQAGTAFGQAAAYWALTERYVDEVAAENKNVCVVRFQRLKEERNAYLLDVLDALGVEGAELVPEGVFEKRSMTAQESTEDAQKQGNSGWEDTLTASEANEVDRALDVFDFTSSAYTG